MTNMRTLLPLMTLMTLMLFGSSSCAPPPPPPAPAYHSFCSSLWLFSAPCAEVSTKVAAQIQAFTPIYTLLSATPLKLTANHTSLDGVQGENITFTFTSTLLTVGCRVSGRSESQSFTTLLDGGLNYCNLHNLLSASGLTSDPGFMEMTNEWACLGYKLSTCSMGPAEIMQIRQRLFNLF
ncbi:hypothetical protein JOB18_008037 [Solea senegalensis]|nr:hypothetical protein JOB18_008037 [Solea senegalensis]